VRAPIVAPPARPRVPDRDRLLEAPTRPGRTPSLSDLYVSALLAEDVLPETWGFDAAPDEQKVYRRHKFLLAGGLLIGFGCIAELIDFVISHLR
jgi:hypothetical protein